MHIHILERQSLHSYLIATVNTNPLHTKRMFSYFRTWFTHWKWRVLCLSSGWSYPSWKKVIFFSQCQMLAVLLIFYFSYHALNSSSCLLNISFTAITTLRLSSAIKCYYLWLITDTLSISCMVQRSSFPPTRCLKTEMSRLSALASDCL